jgi:hypothetical protein
MATVTDSAKKRVDAAKTALAANDPAKFGENKSAALTSPAQSRVIAAQTVLQISPAPKQPKFGGSHEKIEKLEKEVAALEARLTRKKGATIRGQHDVKIYTAIIKKLKQIENLKTGAGRTRRRKNMSRTR